STSSSPPSASVPPPLSAFRRNRRYPTISANASAWEGAGGPEAGALRGSERLELARAESPGVSEATRQAVAASETPGTGGVRGGLAQGRTLEGRYRGAPPRSGELSEGDAANVTEKSERRHLL